MAKSRVQTGFSAVVVCMGRPLRAHILIEILCILMGERSVAHPELRALFDALLRAALLGYTDSHSVSDDLIRTRPGA